MRVQLFITCLVDLVYPEVGERTVALLERLGCEVAFPAAQTCCGQPAQNSGHPAEARRVASHFLDVFAPTEGPIVAPFGSCAHMVHHYYPELFSDDPERLAQARDVIARTFDIASFIVDELGHAQVGGRYPGPEGTTIAWHPECHLMRGQGVREQPLSLLRGVEGCELVEPEHADLCCGFGGTFSMKLPEISAAWPTRSSTGPPPRAPRRSSPPTPGASCTSRAARGAAASRSRIHHLVDLLEPEGTL